METSTKGPYQTLKQHELGVEKYRFSNKGNTFLATVLLSFFPLKRISNNL